ncbi:hypothetical protein [[Scytonema hofmanni] UTEX B 1581]|nr:hypothetical protein [[Scytonema hofmanni] UTEX B 1581]
MGNGQWAMGIKEAAVSDADSNTILSMPYALCPMPHALCPMPYAQCPMPDAHCQK